MQQETYHESIKTIPNGHQLADCRFILLVIDKLLAKSECHPAWTIQNGGTF